MIATLHAGYNDWLRVRSFEGRVLGPGKLGGVFMTDASHINPQLSMAVAVQESNLAGTREDIRGDMCAVLHVKCCTYSVVYESYIIYLKYRSLMPESRASHTRAWDCLA